MWKSFASIASSRSQLLITVAGCVLAMCYGYVASPGPASIAHSLMSADDREGERCARDPVHGCDSRRQTDYAPPMANDFAFDLVIPLGYTLRDAWLVLDDTAGTQDSRRTIVDDFHAEPGVAWTTPSVGLERLAFTLGFFKLGINRFQIQGNAVNGTSVRKIETATQELAYAVPSRLGLLGPGTFRLPPAHFPRRIADCLGELCKDRDGDGLNDLWENVAAAQLSPRLMMDSGDGLFAGLEDSVRVLTSVTPVTRGNKSYVLFASAVAFSRDYGYLGAWDHAGDTEAFGMLFRVDADDTLHWVASTAKGHPCLVCSPRYHWRTQDFGDDGAPLVFVERNKHGLWSNERACQQEAAFGCRSDLALRPAAVNIGDYAPKGSSALVDALDNLAPDGPFGELAGTFPGDALWTPSKAKVRGRFCGGQRNCSARNSANQPGAVIAMLVKLFDRIQ
jgi:hypothetical protein